MVFHNKRRTTRADVARLAGVSGGTVARVLSGHKDVAPGTREKVLKVIKELGYQPDLVARTLRSGRSNQIGLIVPDEKNLFFHGIISGVGQEASDRGYALLLGYTKWGYRKLIDSFVGRKADAVICCVGGAGDDELGPLFSSGIPICTCGFRVPEYPDIPWISPDYEGGAKAAAQHLLDLGHRRIALFYGGSPEEQPSRRMSGWLSALKDTGLEPVAAARGYWSYEAGSLMVKAAVDSGATAVLTENDVMAMGFISAAIKTGLRIPEDISIVGFDDIWMAPSFRPPLTTVRMFAEDLGKRAVGIALGASQDELVENCISPVELVIRESTMLISK